MTHDDVPHASASPPERRQHPRVPGPRVRGPVTVIAYEGSTGVAVIELSDISLGGLRLTTTHAERPGARVSLRLRLAGDEPPTGSVADDPDVVSLRGQIVWARQAPPFQAGVRFLGLDAPRRELLAKVAGPVPA